MEYDLAGQERAKHIVKRRPALGFRSKLDKPLRITKIFV
jgi:hypothetical protein